MSFQESLLENCNQMQTLLCGYLTLHLGQWIFLTSSGMFLCTTSFSLHPKETNKIAVNIVFHFKHFYIRNQKVRIPPSSDTSSLVYIFSYKILLFFLLWRKLKAFSKFKVRAQCTT